MKKLIVLLVSITVLLSACGQAPAPAATSPSVNPTVAPTSTVAASGDEVKIDLKGFKFSPDSVTIKVGQTVTWTNQDSANHNVVASDKSWKSETMGKGAVFSHKFETAGTFEYVCTFHSGMKGKIIVEP